MNEVSWQAITRLSAILEAEKIGYEWINSTALSIQGVQVPDLEILEVSVQWDLFPQVHQLFQKFGAGSMSREGDQADFTFEMNDLLVRVICFYHTVIITDPDRVQVKKDGQAVWVKSVQYYQKHLEEDDPRRESIKEYLIRLQKEHSQINKEAWQQSAYDAWVKRFGYPEVAVERIKKSPAKRLGSLYPYIGDLQGKKVINLLGSHGSKAVAMALLGADVTVVDISEDNARYAHELAQVAGVQLRYLVSDVLELPKEERTSDYDLVLMELGILHYFIDLKPLTSLVRDLLRPGGRLLLQDFHPISTKLITSKGKKHKVTGNYFDSALEQTEVAYTKLLPNGEQLEKKVRLRKWTLGEVVSAVADAGLIIRLLVEEPNSKVDDIGIPKTFTLIAEK